MADSRGGEEQQEHRPLAPEPGGEPAPTRMAPHVLRLVGWGPYPQVVEPRFVLGLGYPSQRRVVEEGVYDALLRPADGSMIQHRHV